MGYDRQAQRWLGLWQQSTRLPLTWLELWLASAETVGARVTAIGAAGLNPNARQRRENQRMVTEKAQAGMESLNLLLTPSPALPQAYWRLWSSLWRPQLGAAAWLPWWELMLVTSEQNLAAWSGGARPWHRRATANARRLRRR